MKALNHTTITWTGKVFSGGTGGAGFVALPKNIYQDIDFNHGDRVKLNLQNGPAGDEITVDKKLADYMGLEFGDPVKVMIKKINRDTENNKK